MRKWLESKQKNVRAYSIVLGFAGSKKLPKRWKPKEVAVQMKRNHFLMRFIPGLALTICGLGSWIFSRPDSLISSFPVSGCIGAGFFFLVNSKPYYDKWRQQKQLNSTTLNWDPILSRDGQLAGWELSYFQSVLTPDEYELCADIPGEVLRKMFGNPTWEPTPENLSWAKTIFHEMAAAPEPLKALKQFQTETFFAELKPINSWFSSAYIMPASYRNPTIESAILFISYMDLSGLKLIPVAESPNSLESLNQSIALALVGKDFFISEANEPISADVCEVMRPELETMVLQTLRNAEVELRIRQQ